MTIFSSFRRKDISLKELHLSASKLWDFYSNEFTKSKCPGLVIDPNTKIISWMIGCKKKYLEFKGDVIRTNTPKRVMKLLDRIRQMKRRVVYTENTTSDENPIIIDLPYIDFFEGTAEEFWDYVCELMGYISPWSRKVIANYIKMEGSWLLQGESGTGKTQFVNVMALNWHVDRIMAFNGKIDIVRVLDDVAAYRYSHPNTKVLVVFEEFDRTISMSPEITDKVLFDIVKPYVKSKMGGGCNGLSEVDEIITDTITKTKTGGVPKSYNSGKIDVDNYSSASALVVLATAYKTLVETTIKPTKSARIDIDAFMKFLEAVQQYSLSFLNNSKIVFTTNSVFRPSIQNATQQRSVDIALRIGRCNVLQYTYMTFEMLKIAIVNRYPNMTEDVVMKLIPEMMQAGFNKQYNLKEFFNWYGPETTDEAFEEMVNSLNEFKRITTLDGFRDNIISASPSVATPVVNIPTTNAGMLEGVIN